MAQSRVKFNGMELWRVILASCRNGVCRDRGAGARTYAILNGCNIGTRTNRGPENRADPGSAITQPRRQRTAETFLGLDRKAGRQVTPAVGTLIVGTLIVRILGLAGLTGVLASALTPLPNIIIERMGGVERLERSDAVIVLARGGFDPDGVLSNSSLRRTLKGIELYRQGLAPLLVLSGATGSTGVGEAGLRMRLARALGVPTEAILAVSSGRTTREEGLHLRERLRPLGVRRILLVADRVDMPRSRAVFARVGFEVFPAPTASGLSRDPENRLGMTREIAGELLGWLYYWLRGHV
jgi:uncharacterized SAM-binding protein YcdF (DUF218 family)